MLSVYTDLVPEPLLEVSALGGVRESLLRKQFRWFSSDEGLLLARPYCFSQVILHIVLFQ